MLSKIWKAATAVFSMTFLLGASGCPEREDLPPPAPTVVKVEAARLPPPPAWVMEPQEPTFLRNLENYLAPKQGEPTR